MEAITCREKMLTEYTPILHIDFCMCVFYNTVKTFDEIICPLITFMFTKAFCGTVYQSQGWWAISSIFLFSGS